MKKSMLVKIRCEICGKRQAIMQHISGTIMCNKCFQNNRLIEIERRSRNFQ